MFGWRTVRRSSSLCLLSSPRLSNVRPPFGKNAAAVAMLFSLVATSQLIERVCVGVCRKEAVYLYVVCKERVLCKSRMYESQIPMST
jgi:hypothetical protein